MSTTNPIERRVGDTPKGGSVLGFYAPRGTPRPPRIARGEGIFLWDSDGRRYLDATAGAVVANIGHGNPRVLAAMAEQAGRVTFAYPRFFESEHSIALSDKVCTLAGEGFDRAFFVSGGSEANESALKLARQYAVVGGQARRFKVISREPSYHGATLGALAVTGDAHTLGLYGPMVREMPKVPAPLSYRLPEGHTADTHAMACADALEETIVREGPDSVLAFILEPVGGLSSGAVVSPAAYYRRVREICDRHGVLLIYDEIMSGAGRTGAFLAAHHFADARPDIVTLAKGLAAGYTPLGAMLVPNRIVDAVAGAGGFVHGHTYFTNPLSCAVADAVLDEVVRQDLVAQARIRGEQLMGRLRALAERSPIVGDVRGKGLLTAIEIVADNESKRQLPAGFNAPARLTEHGLRRGIALYNRRANLGAYGDMQLVTPPLTISEAEVDLLADMLEAALRDLADEIAVRQPA
ncbi:aminotransferase family protein [Variovorax ginsengisoli]|uniref:Aspartate aminotransferase family protein n=1 Tax=Variovorax ginsengisoli TaxID=363844 RepID=A0ABT8SA85_9BURK|nr:aspartate aminotransferase family protein [Variovorax ginsengisoli]MDN8615181.1 aspartate aminotransferase family protein [Variovorax ginsengisoli]MDO1534351.1 aspartate aminotransferase family protein [Variovorax ginsengisoli]